MSENGRSTTEETVGGSAKRDLSVAYRHDVHKFTGEPHASAREMVAGVPVNQPVPHGADSDAAALSRPPGTPEQTVANHRTHARLSLLTGSPAFDEGVRRIHRERAIDRLVMTDDPDAMHRAWLESEVAGGFNESVYYPYTSLKYHTLLVAALLDAYRAGHEFADLFLIVDPTGEVVPHRTVYADEAFTLRITGEPTERLGARLGVRPRRSWASVWSRLAAHPLDTDGDAWDRVLDANLRRIRSWSTALQYLEDVRDGGGRP